MKALKSFLKFLWMGPAPMPEDHLTVRFHLLGGQVVTTYHVLIVKATKNPAGGFNSYSIEWHEGFKPSMFSLTLGHISAIEVLKG